MRKHVYVAVLGGFGLSALLFVLSYWTASTALLAPQAIGFYICMLVRGIHSATKSDYALIALPINGAIYFVVILLALQLFRRQARA